MRDTELAGGRPRWTIDAFSGFWADPTLHRARGVRLIITDDIVGHWPRNIGTVRGAENYMHVIEAVVRCTPRVALRVEDYASDGDITFVHWAANATIDGMTEEFHGCDRMRVVDGIVTENYIFCDNAWFDRVAALL
jgi:predicted SnoaL-like aldol condensation-catalyzing enzyme